MDIRLRPSGGASADTLLLGAVQPAQAGSYAVVVTNAAGAVTSAVASLTVLVSPTVTIQPSNQTAVAGTSASFSVTATGTAPLGYQWTFDSAPLLGASAAALLLGACGSPRRQLCRGRHERGRSCHQRRRQLDRSGVADSYDPAFQPHGGRGNKRKLQRDGHRHHATSLPMGL